MKRVLMSAVLAVIGGLGLAGGAGCRRGKWENAWGAFVAGVDFA